MDGDQFGDLSTRINLLSNPSFALNYSAPQQFLFTFTPETPGTYTLNPWGSNHTNLIVSIIAGGGGGTLLKDSSATIEFLAADNSVLKILTQNAAYASAPDRFSFGQNETLTESFSFSSMRVSLTLGTAYHNDTPVTGMSDSTQLYLADTRIEVNSSVFGMNVPTTYDGPDLITFTAVPEPSTYAALAGLLALACVGLRRWRKNRNKAA